MKNNTQQIESTNVISFIPDANINNELAMFNAIKQFPDLSDSVESPLELGCTYWTPTTIGESIKCIIISVENSIYPKIDEKTGEVSDLILPCVIMAVQHSDLTLEKVSNGSKRLVALIQGALANGSITAFSTALKVTYLGKVRNSTNSFSCDSFSVKILMLNN